MRLQAVAIACAAVAWAQTAGAAPMRGRVVLRFESGAPAKEQTRFAAAVEAELASIVAIDVPDTVVVVRVRWREHAATLDFEDAAGAAVAPSRSVMGETVDVVASQAASIVRATVIALREAATPSEPAAAPTSPIEPPPIAITAPVPEPTPAPTTAPAPEPSLPALRAIAPAAEAAPRSADARRADFPSPARASPALASTTPRITFGAFYTGAVYSAEIPWRSGVRIETLFIAAHRGGTWVYAGVGYGFDPSVTVVTPDVTLRTARHTAALIAGLGRAFGALRVGAEIAPLAADTLRNAQSTGDGFSATADHALLSFGGSARARIAWVTAPTHIDMSIGVAAFPSGEAYVVQNGGGEKSVFAPYRIQPELALGIGLDLW